MLEAVSVSFTYGGKRVLEDISLRLEKGETLGIIGPNGSGKSTLLKLLSGIEKPVKGVVRLHGRPVSSYSRKQLARQIAVLTQEPLPGVEFSVAEVLKMGRFPYQNAWGGEEADVEALMEPVIRAAGIEHLLEAPLSALSGGERQRVAIAKAMIQQPSVLLLDEPTAFLDIGYQAQTLALIRQWQKQSGLSVIMVLHDLNWAAHVCDRLMLLHEGKVAADGAPGAVLTKEHVERIYAVKVTVMSHPLKPVPVVYVDLE